MIVNTAKADDLDCGLCIPIALLKTLSVSPNDLFNVGTLPVQKILRFACSVEIPSCVILSEAKDLINKETFPIQEILR